MLPVTANDPVLTLLGNGLLGVKLIKAEALTTDCKAVILAASKANDPVILFILAYLAS